MLIGKSFQLLNVLAIILSERPSYFRVFILNDIIIDMCHEFHYHFLHQ